MTEAPRLARAIFATWPAVSVDQVGPFSVPTATGAGNRVSAARLSDESDDGAAMTMAEVEAVTEAQARADQSPLFMVFGWQSTLDRLLADMGFETRDATEMLLGNVSDIAQPPPPVSCFDIWPPLAVAEDIWAEGGIGPDRLAVMRRVAGPKTTLLGRIGDRPAGAAFLAIDGSIAMLHALEVRPRARRQGLARVMVRAGADWARKNGAERLAVLVTRENAAALGLYASLGLEAVENYHYRSKPRVNARHPT